MPLTIEQIRDQLSNVLFHMPYAQWVTGVAIGEALEDAPTTPEILVFVQAVCDSDLQPVRDLLAFAQTPAQLGPFPFSLLRTGLFEGLQAQTGDSLGLRAPSQFNLPLVSGGTFGCVVRNGNARYALTSNHVIAHNGRAPLGTAIVSPSTVDAVAGGVVGLLTDFVPLQPMGWPAPVLPSQPPALGIATVASVPKNTVDCALARIVPAAGIQAATPVNVFPGSPIRQAVQKTGRTTGTTRGVITIRACDACIDFSFGTFIFQDLVGVIDAKAFAAPGDSGSLAIRQNAPNEGIGVLTARGYSTDARGRWIGYIVLMCGLQAVRGQLATAMGIAPATNLTFFRD